jgi:hypothetical protein
MAQPRLQLHEILETLVPDPDNVYFQPPTNVKMKYPAIVYQRDFAETLFADNSPYRHTKRYMVTVIDQDPDSEIPDKVARLPLCSFNRFYTADNLNHDVFTIFF